MRTKNHLEVKDVCRRAIPKLMKVFGLGEVEQIRTDELGWVNPVFFVNEKLVFRFNARDVSLPKLQREAQAFLLLKDTRLPVPELILLDDSKKISPFDVTVTKKIDGINIEFAWPTLNAEKRSNLAEKAGQILKIIHSISLNSFGDLSPNRTFSQTNDWAEYLQRKISFHIQEAQEFHIFNTDQVLEINEIFNFFKNDLKTITQAKLVHVDFHFGNLLYRDTEIVGVLDFEWSLAGDPLYDLSYSNSMDDSWPGSRSSFLKGYGIPEFDEVSKLRLRFYQMVRNIELCVVAQKHFFADEAVAYLKTTVNQIESLKNAIAKVLGAKT